MFRFQRYQKLAFLVLFLVFVSFPDRSFAPPKKEVYYNEVFDDEGNLRPQYKDIYDAISGLSKTSYEKFFRIANKVTKKDIPLSPTPRILTESEYATVKEGVEQRAHAIQAFLIDHYQGKQKYRDTVIPGVIIDEILKRSGDDQFVGKIPKDLPFRFVYGPDIIRDKAGNWLVFEDNLGFVGGSPGDTVPTRDIWSRYAPQLASLVPAQNNPRDHVVDLFEKMKEHSNPSFGFRQGDGAIVYLAYPPYADKEDPRFMEMLEKMGVTFVTANTAKGSKNGSSKKIIVKEDGVYLQETTKYGNALPEKKVGFLWMSGEHSFYDHKNPLLEWRALTEEVENNLLEQIESEIKKGKASPKALEAKRRLEEAMKPDPKTGTFNTERLKAEFKWALENYQDYTGNMLVSKPVVSGLTDAILDGRVQSNYTPGIDFVGDKMFHTFIEDLVRFYLKEEPILKNPNTRRFFKVGNDGKIVLDEKTFEDALKNKDGRVVKIVDGRGGKGINLGVKKGSPEWKGIVNAVRENITKSISQDYTHPPVVHDGHQERIVDLRPISFVDEKGILVSRTPFGRSTLKAGSGLMNMSAGSGVEMNVIIVPDPDCHGSLAKLSSGG